MGMDPECRDNDNEMLTTTIHEMSDNTNKQIKITFFPLLKYIFDRLTILKALILNLAISEHLST